MAENRVESRGLDYRAEDQVVRHMRFSKAHPEVTFRFRREMRRWEATYPAGESGTQAICFTELRHVLDELEKRLGETRGPARQAARARK
jgi:hypothetical protein